MDLRTLALALALALGTLPVQALAADVAPAPVAAATRRLAADHFDKGSAALDAGKPAEAAVHYLAADAVLPNDEALEAALEAALKADASLLALEGADRATTRSGARASVSALAARARALHAGKVARLTLHCEAPCSATLDAAARPVDTPMYVAPGRHVVSWRLRDGSAATSELDVSPGTASTLGPPVTSAGVVPAPAPPAPPAPVPAPAALAPAPAPAPAPVRSASAAPPAPETPERSRRPLPSWVFWSGVGLTAVASGLTIASGIDTTSQHGAFVERGCLVNLAGAGCATAAEAGRAAETRTNVALGVSIGAAVVTTVLGAWLVDFGSPTRARAGFLRRAGEGATVRF